MTRFYGGVWDPSTSDLFFYRDADVLLTPLFNGGQHLEALRLAEADVDSLAASSLATPSTIDGEGQEKLKGAWDGIKKHVNDAVMKQRERALSVDDRGPFKCSPTSSEGRGGGRARVEDCTFDLGGDPSNVVENKYDRDILEQEVTEGLFRYEGLFMQPSDASYTCPFVLSPKN